MQSSGLSVLARGEGYGVPGAMPAGAASERAVRPADMLAALRLAEQQVALEELRRDRDRLCSALRRAPLILFRCDRALRITWMADPAGFPLPNALGKRLDELLPPKQVAPLLRALARGLQAAAGRREEVAIETPRGRRVWDLTLQPERDTSGATVGLSVAALDATERRQAEEALQEGAERLTFALDCAEAGMWDWDIRAGKLYWSERYFRLHGLDPAAPASYELWLSAVHPEDRAHAGRAVRETLAARRKNFRVEFRVLHPEKGLRWIAGIGKAVYGPRGLPVRMTGINIDITERKTAELAGQAARDEALAAKAQAEQASLTKARFFEAASHDLRQPAQSLALLLTVLEMRLNDHPASVVLGPMRRALEALDMLLGGMLDIAKLDAGMVVPSYRVFPVGDLLERLAADMRPLAEARRLDLRIMPCAAKLFGDPLLLDRLLRHLLDNALRYTPSGGVLVGCRRRGSHLRIDVVDTGVGIPEDQREAVFDEFYQLGNPERDRSQGLGLGLAIVRRLAHVMGLRVELCSIVGKGSRFSVEVPLLVAEP